MPLQPAAHTVPCCVDVPDRFERRARYALRMILRPLGIDPVWVRRDDVRDGGLYYGRATSEAAVHLPFDPEAADVLEATAPTTVAAPVSIRWDGETWPLIFGTPHAPDLVASTFYWLSGWEERATVARDRYGRVVHAGSLPDRLGTTTRPVVDAYRAMVAERLAAACVPMTPATWDGAPWALVLTHDVDYIRKWRPGIVYREVVQYALGNRRREPVAARLDRLGRGLVDFLTPPDPFQRAMHRMVRETLARDGRATYFFKGGAHGPQDVAYALSGRFVRAFMAQLRTAGFDIGLHPSFHAHTHPGYLRAEREALRVAAGVRLSSVRTHYLRYEAPTTPRLLDEADFAIDSTLGFAEHEGFRRGTCHPFQLYDLDADRPLELWECPLILMESAVFNRRHLTGDAARAATTALLDQCRRFGGLAVALWHTTLWDELDFPGWGHHFLNTMDDARAMGGRLLSLRDAMAAFGLDVAAPRGSEAMLG